MVNVVRLSLCQYDASSRRVKISRKMGKCAVLYCKNYSGHTRNVSYHAFPVDPNRRRKWVEAVRRQNTWIPTKNHCICSIHFAEECYNANSTKQIKLHKDSTPTLNLPKFLRCCGMTDARNYDMSVWQLRRLGPRGLSVPPSCCVQRARDASYLNPAPVNQSRCQELQPNPEFRYVPGCYSRLEDWYQKQYLVFMLGLFVIALVKLGILLSTVYSCVRLRKRRQDIRAFVMKSIDNKTNENIYDAKMSSMHDEPITAKYIQPNNFYSPRVRNPRIFHSKPNEMI